MLPLPCLIFCDATRGLPTPHHHRCARLAQEFSEIIGKGVNERDRVIKSLNFKDIAKVTWDHQHSSAKMDIRIPAAEAYMIIEVENSLELEQNLSLR